MPDPEGEADLDPPPPAALHLPDPAPGVPGGGDLQGDQAHHVLLRANITGR